MDITEAFQIVLEIAKGNAANLLHVPTEYTRQQEAIRIIRQRLADGLPISDTLSSEITHLRLVIRTAREEIEDGDEAGAYLTLKNAGVS